MINLIILTALTLFYKDKCNSAPSPNILTICSALETLEYDISFGMIHRYLQKKITFFLRLIEKKRPTLGNLVVIGRIKRVTTTFWCS